MNVTGHSGQDRYATEPVAVSSLVVNRTHRVVRQRASLMRARRSRAKSLWIPLFICSGLLLVLCAAIWSVLDQYELAPVGIPDASQQLLLLMVWSLPLSAGLLALVWFRRNDVKLENGTERL